jgi:hypothetical protein
MVLERPGEYNHSYHGHFLRFMGWYTKVDDKIVEYSKKHMFDQSLLLTITPESVERYLRFRTYGDENHVPAEGDKICLRSNTLECIKKSISWYMPNRIGGWNVENNGGNPTKSIHVNNFVKYVRKVEVRREGKPSSAKRALTMEEFRMGLTLFEKISDFNHCYRYTTMMKFQYHLIARCDDMGNFKIRDVYGNTDPLFCSFCLQTKVHWSKNVQEERDCPDQILLGSSDPDYCILLAFALYFEIWLIAENGMNGRVLLFSDEREFSRAAVGRSKALYCSRLNAVMFHNEIFRESASGPLGSHSLRKYSSTYATSNGCTMDEVDRRGRWKRNSGRIVDRYIDVEQKHIDCKVAGSLCVGGPIKYKLREDSGLTLAWVAENITPGIFSFFGVGSNNKITEVLCLALLWSVFDNCYSNKLPDWLIVKVKSSYQLVKVLDDNINPVEKKALCISQLNGRLRIDEYMIEENNTSNNTIENRDILNGILIQQQQLQQQMIHFNENVNNNFSMMRKDFEKSNSIINKNIRQLLIQPARKNLIKKTTMQERAEINNLGSDLPLRGRVGGPHTSQCMVELSRCPRNLHVLWEEYIVGLAGCKPAKDFTSQERGKNKTKYSIRLPFWSCVSMHVNAGFSAFTCIEKIYKSYGEKLSVYTILKEMQKDKAKGGHPNLQI